MNVISFLGVFYCILIFVGMIAFLRLARYIQLSVKTSKSFYERERQSNLFFKKDINVAPCVASLVIATLLVLLLFLCLLIFLDGQITFLRGASAVLLSLFLVVGFLYAWTQRVLG